MTTNARRARGQQAGLEGGSDDDNDNDDEGEKEYTKNTPRIAELFRIVRIVIF